MKLLAILLAAIGLSGCVAYGGGVYSADGAYTTQPYYAGTQPYYAATSPYYAGTYPSYGTYYGGTTTYVVPAHRDRDGDGIPDRYDRRPYNPRIW